METSTYPAEDPLAPGWMLKDSQTGLARAIEVAILDVLEAHGVKLPQETQDLIGACTHPFTLIHRPISPWSKRWAAEGEARTLDSTRSESGPYL
jgi:hypothetical protein